MTKVVTLGELMLRLSPDGYLRLIQADRLNISFGGGEANVAVSLANYGYDSWFITKLPDNDIGQMAVNSLRRYGVRTEGILRGGERLGIYFVEKGASQRSSRVLYDRKQSAIATADPGDFDWEQLLEDSSWFHVTGITPALGPQAAELCIAACRTAQACGVTVSCDLNYRQKLWSKTEACATMQRIMPYVDVCIANEEDAANVFDIRSSNTDATQGKLNAAGYTEVASRLSQSFGCKTVAITLRKSMTANDNQWQAMLYTEGASYFSKAYAVHIVDRVGSGDSFAAGLIYGTLSGMGPQERLEFAAAAGCLKHSIEGDFNMVTPEEVLALVRGNGSGRVQR